MIVLNKKNKIWELYPIGSPKGALNEMRTPKFIGKLKFKTNSPDNSYKLSRFTVVKDFDDEEDKFYPPSQAIKLLKSQAVFISSHDEKIEEFLSLNHIKYRLARICNHCVFDGKITVINSKNSYLYHNQKICKKCSYEIIKGELKLNGIDKKLFKQFKKVLDKTGDLNKVIAIINSKFDPVKNPDFTLFDKVGFNKSSENDNGNKFPKIAINRLKIDNKFKKIIDKNKNSYLLPIQYLAIKEGLLQNESLLVVSATGSGKTLVGELAGINNLLKGNGKFIYLTPLVALANQKYHDFKKKYSSLGLKVAIKVGKNRIKAKGELKITDGDISTGDIIVGTYEGVDFTLRSGKYKNLGDVGTVLIDEIHTLDDDERGIRLNGLIRRVMKLFPKSQIIGLSATIKNQKQIANDFNLKLVEYDKRPVPLERHLILVKNTIMKNNIIKKLSINEFKTISSKGFKGQTIVFTNSRKKTQELAEFLKRKKIKARAYHAGLSYYKKERIEKDFAKGKIAVVVTTAALAAGVDFPASQVIFDSLLMGNKWISSNEFHQMLGRAGRPTYNDIGKVYLIPEIGRNFDGENEEVVALDLLNSDVDNVKVEFNEDFIIEQILSDISSYSINNINDIYKEYDDYGFDTEMLLNELFEYKLIKSNVVTNNNNNNNN
ncbi:MAG: DEAD/DEAH box helicase, partial [Methanobrevibacter sp.]|nr:DEAD/DEAH box helicase [Candidatus Methanoflexus mossambicus]